MRYLIGIVLTPFATRIVFRCGTRCWRWKKDDRIRKALILALLVIAACDGSRSVVAPPAALHPVASLCAYDGTCISAPDRPMICDRGFCVPRHCLAGTQGCACYGNSTCDLLDGTPMSCIGNLCTRTTPAGAGALNGPCSPTEMCGSADGGALSCTRGHCEEPDCPSGSLGCPCGTYGGCSPIGARQPACFEGRCQFAGCAAGSEGCRCDTGDRCGDTMRCAHGVCFRTPGHALVVEGDVRSCQVLLSGNGSEHSTPLWSTGVRGQSVARDGRLALSFMSRTDVRLGASPVRVVGESGAAAPTVQSYECFDNLGRRVTDALVRWEP